MRGEGGVGGDEAFARGHGFHASVSGSDSDPAAAYLIETGCQRVAGICPASSPCNRGFMD